jgi:hypothetical protein
VSHLFGSDSGAEGTENSSLVIALDSEHEVVNNITNITRNGSSTSISICGSPDHNNSAEFGIHNVACSSPDQVL